MSSNLPVQLLAFHPQAQPVYLPVAIDYPVALGLRQMAMVQDELPKAEKAARMAGRAICVIQFFERSSYLTGGHPSGIQREELVIHPGNTGLIFLYQLWFEGTVTIARSTQFQWTVVCDNGLCGITIAGVSSRSGLIFLIPEMVCHLCIESGFNAEFFQQPIKLTEVFRGFEFFGQFVSQSL